MAPSSRRQASCALAFVSSNEPRPSARRFAVALARLTYEMPTRMFTEAPLANVRYAPDPLPGTGNPFGPNCVPPLASVPPGVTVASVHVPVPVNGWSNSARKYSV